MKKFRVIAVIVMSGVLVALAIGINLDKFNTKAEDNCCGSRSYPVPPVSIQNPKEVKLPEYVPYMFLFQHLANVKDKTSQVRQIQNKSELTDGQFRKLIQTAVKYQNEVSGLDAQAKVFIDAFHAAFPPGPMPEGTAPPPPPEELADLQAKRDAAAIRYRDQLKEELGNDGYQKFLRYVDETKSRVSGEPLRKELYPKQEVK